MIIYKDKKDFNPINIKLETRAELLALFAVIGIAVPEEVWSFLKAKEQVEFKDSDELAQMLSDIYEELKKHV